LREGLNNREITGTAQTGMWFVGTVRGGEERRAQGLSEAFHQKDGSERGTRLWGGGPKGSTEARKTGERPRITNPDCLYDGGSDQEKKKKRPRSRAPKKTREVTGSTGHFIGLGETAGGERGGRGTQWVT